MEVIFNFKVEGHRISREDLNMAIAELMSLRGTCERGAVGCVITQFHRIVSTGYNGSITSNDCRELGCDIQSKCVNAAHAEINAITAAAKFGIALAGSYMYCTVSPCKSCAIAIFQAGIIKLFYKRDYISEEGKNIDGINLLKQKGVEVIKL